MPILGILASGISGNLLSPSYDSIATVTVSTAVSSISFTSIPATYKHLQIRGIYKASATNGGSPLLWFNNDTTSGYASHQLSGDGATATAGSNQPNPSGMLAGAATQSTAQFTAFVIDILDYANTSKNKTSRLLVGYDANGSGVSQFGSGVYFSTTAVSRIDMSPQSANFAQYSSFALYGVK